MSGGRISRLVGLQASAQAPVDARFKVAFWRGFLANLLNPKVGVFYVTFLPQFVPAGASVASSSFWLAFLHVMLTLLWFSVLIAATVPLSSFLRQPSAVKTLDRLTGGIFVAFGIKLATSSAH
jgi:threonine/homoserine/homoserine lactone efflux protein